jgi:23S rRNA-/tRNA-specific pseudouridylate synthase
LYGAPVHALGLKRQFLHAAALQFTTPSGEHLHLTSDLPPDLAKVLRGLDEGV